jgi:hypothetical protein
MADSYISITKGWLELISKEKTKIQKNLDGDGGSKTIAFLCTMDLSYTLVNLARQELISKGKMPTQKKATADGPC